MDLRVIGVDEAGRGSFIGPLVIAGISIPASQELLLRLRELGVRDSKKLSPAMREAIFRQLRQLDGVRIKVFKLSPQLIDSYVWSRDSRVSLNYLEAIYMGRLIGSLPGDLAVLDAADASESLFLENVLKHVRRKVMIISSHHADERYLAVSAASIVAKVTRDMEISRIHRLIGDFGSGYPSDPRTIDFIRRADGMPELIRFIRLSWKTLNKIERLKSL